MNGSLKIEPDFWGASHLRPMLIFGLFFLTLLVRAQGVAVLGDYDLSQKGYTLIFHIPVKSEAKYVLYTQRQEKLEAYKKTWVFDKEAATYPFACNDGFNIELQKNHQSLEFFGVRLKCNAFIARGEYWDLPLSIAISHINLDTAYTSSRKYETLEAAREGLAIVKQNPYIIGVSQPEWEKNDGYFHFRYPNPAHSPKSPPIDWNQLTAEVKELIKRKFPNEDFCLTLTYYGYGKNYPQVGFKLSGKKTLFSAFDLYPKSDRGWVDFEPELTFYIHR